MLTGSWQRIGALLHDKGLRFTFYKVYHAMGDMVRAISAARHFGLSAAETTELQQMLPPVPPLVSVLVPLYSPPEEFLRPMLESVLAQVYPVWELCLADGSPDGDKQAELVCRDYVDKDGRIHYKRLQGNLGIAGNSNASAAMASGEYLLLLDQDDLLHPAAIARLIQAALAGADFVYADEAVFSRSILYPRRVHWKQGFSLIDLLANNYICHPALFSARLFRRGGGFREGFDGSQDHELFLRLTSMAEHVQHVAQVLYFWRSHVGSVAAGIAAKPYAREAGLRAVRSFLMAAGREVQVSEAAPSVYRVQWRLREPEVGFSVIVLGKRERKNCQHLLRLLAACADAREVLVVENAMALRQALYTAQQPYVLLLRGDMLSQGAIGPMLRELLSLVQQPDIGLVGSVLLRGRKICSAGWSSTAKIAGRVSSGVWRANGVGMDGSSEGYMRRLLYTHAVDGLETWGTAGRREYLQELLAADREILTLPRGQVYLTPYSRWRMGGDA